MLSTADWNFEFPFVSGGLSIDVTSQQTRDVHPLLWAQRWANVADARPTLNLQWVSVSCLLGCQKITISIELTDRYLMNPVRSFSLFLSILFSVIHCTIDLRPL